MPAEVPFIGLEPSELTYPCSLCGGMLVGECDVTSLDGTCNIDADTVPSCVDVQVLVGVDADGGQSLKVAVYSLSINNTTLSRTMTVRVYSDGGGEAYLTLNQRGLIADGGGAVATPSEVSAPYEGATVAVAVAVDPAYPTIAAEVRVDETVLPDWISVRYGDGPMAFTLVIAENGSSEPREARVLAGTDDGYVAAVDVTQEGVPDYQWRPLHYGEFPDIRGVVWRCEVHGLTGRETEASELTFPADSPLVIEWPSSGFDEPVWGSSATLRVVSPGDRTYIGLYTVAPGTVRLDVYRDGSLYWSGMLDPEFYEEPYERLSGYEVSLTFTDFGILDRLKYDLEEIQGLTAVINRAVELSGISHLAEGSVAEFDYSMVGLSFAESFGDYGSDLFHANTGIAVRSDNFTDEEGEVMTFMEVLEGVLRPLGLKMVQRRGMVTLFDLAGLRAVSSSEAVVWAGDSQTLGVDKVYSRVNVTFSPYADSELAGDGVTFDAPVSVEETNFDVDGGDKSGVKFWTYRNYEGEDSKYNYDFNLYLSAEGSGVTFGQYAPISEYFHILPIFGSADECSGVPFLFYVEQDLLGAHYGETPTHRGYDLGYWGTVFTCGRVYVPAGNEHLLRIVMETLVDCRYNPFASSDDSDNNWNYDGNQDRLEENSAFMFLGANVTLYDSSEGGTALYHLENILATNYDRCDLGMGYREWKEGAASPGDFYFEWYNPDDLTDNSGAVGGWKGNRHAVGRPDGGGDHRLNSPRSMVKPQLRNADDGEFVPLPPVAGWLEIQVTGDLAGFKYGDANPFEYGKYGDTWQDEGLNSYIRWFLMRCPEVHVVKWGLTFAEDDADDVEYSGTLDAAAADELDIDTVCGTADGVPPTAKGLYSRLGDGGWSGVLHRGGVEGRPEELLIGQLYAQHAERRTVLTGEAETPASLLLTEDNQDGRQFVLTADCQDVRAATSDVEVRELGEDTYVPKGSSGTSDRIYTSSTTRLVRRPRSTRLRECGYELMKK